MTTTAEIASRIRAAAKAVATLWPMMLPVSIPSPKLEGRVTGTGVLADDDSPRSDDLDAVTVILSDQRGHEEDVAFWARVLITEKPVTDVAVHESDMIAMLALLSQHADWLSGHEAGEDCAGDLEHLARKVYALVVGADGSRHAHEMPPLMDTDQLADVLSRVRGPIDRNTVHVWHHRGLIPTAGMTDDGRRLWDLWGVMAALSMREAS